MFKTLSESQKRSLKVQIFFTEEIFFVFSKKANKRYEMKMCVFLLFFTSNASDNLNVQTWLMPVDYYGASPEGRFFLLIQRLHES